MHRSIPMTVALLAVLVLATAAMSPSVTAQGAPTGEHPIVGAWVLDPTPHDASAPPALITIAPGGVAIPGGTEGGLDASWSPTGERSADLTLVAPFVDPQAGFVGFVTARVSLEVSEDGQSFSGSYTVEFPAGMSEASGIEAFGMPVGESGPREVSGRRAAVEPTGEPVGPVPDTSELLPPQ